MENFIQGWNASQYCRFSLMPPRVSFPISGLRQVRGSGKIVGILSQSDAYILASELPSVQCRLPTPNGGLSMSVRRCKPSRDWESNYQNLGTIDMNLPYWSPLPWCLCLATQPPHQRCFSLPGSPRCEEFVHARSTWVTTAPHLYPHSSPRWCVLRPWRP